MSFDPRAQLAGLLLVLAAALFAGDIGIAGTALLACVGIALARAWRASVRLLCSLIPVIVLLVLFSSLAGDVLSGVRVAVRLAALALLGLSFARLADGEALIAGMRALRVPYALTFVLVTGARFIPNTVEDLANLRDSARLRGITLDGPPWRQLAGWRTLLVPLLVITVRRGLQLGEAMEARAFGARPKRTSRVRLHWRATDGVALTLIGAYVVGLFLL